MCSEPGFGASVSVSRTTTGAGSPSRPRLWAARRWPRLRPLPHPPRFCVGTAASSQSSTMAARIQSHVTLRGSFDDAQRKRLAQVAQRCPVHKTLANGVHISDAVSFDSSLKFVNPRLSISGHFRCLPASECGLRRDSEAQAERVRPESQSSTWRYPKNPFRHVHADQVVGHIHSF